MASNIPGVVSDDDDDELLQDHRVDDQDLRSTVGSTETDKLDNDEYLSNEEIEYAKFVYTILYDLDSASGSDCSDSQDELNIHPKSTEENVCDECGFTCLDPFDYKAHLFEHNPDSANEEYSKVFNTMLMLKKKIEVSFWEKKFPCFDCRVGFMHKQALIKHTALYHDSTLKCPVCSVICPNQEQVKLHVKYFHESKLVCPKCGDVLESEKDFFIHMNVVHEMQLSRFCPFCGGNFLSNKKRNNHIMEKHDDVRGCASCHSELICYCSTGISAEDYDDDEENLDEEEIELEDPLLLIPDVLEDLSFRTKCIIVAKLRKGKYISDICKKYELESDDVQELWKLRDAYTLPKGLSKRMNKLLDDIILDWYYEQREGGFEVTGKELIRVAKKYAKESCLIDFIGDNIWLDSFQSKYDISLKASQKKRRPPTRRSKWMTKFLDVTWPEAIKGYSCSEIYTADEVGVFYRDSEGRIRNRIGKKYIHGFDKDRFSIFLCTNVIGSDRNRIVVCGTRDLLCPCRFSRDDLPKYIKHKSCQFTKEMFEDYVTSWNEELKMKNGKAILLLDKTSTHSKLTLSHLKLLFVPSKGSVSLMPIKNKIFTNFRENFRTLFLKYKLICLKRGIKSETSCYDGLYMVATAWAHVTTVDIINGFVMTGYDLPHEKVTIKIMKTVPENKARPCKLIRKFDVPEYYTDLTDLNKYLTVDDELLTARD